MSTTSSLTPDEIRAAAETHRELGPDYQSAVIESFLDKVGREIDARVDARVALARTDPAQPPARPSRSGGRGSVLALAIVSMSLGIPLTAIVTTAGGGIAALVVIWAAIAVINVAYSRSQP